MLLLQSNYRVITSEKEVRNGHLLADFVVQMCDALVGPVFAQRGQDVTQRIRPVEKHETWARALPFSYDTTTTNTTTTATKKKNNIFIIVILLLYYNCNNNKNTDNNTDIKYFVIYLSVLNDKTKQKWQTMTMFNINVN